MSSECIYRVESSQEKEGTGVSKLLTGSVRLQMYTPVVVFRAHSTTFHRHFIFYQSTHFQSCSSVCLHITGKCVKFHKRPVPPTAPDAQKQCTLSRRSGALALPTPRPLRERIIHLLALKPFSKPELLLWMERDRASSKDKAELGGILEEVRTCVCVCVTLTLL